MWIVKKQLELTAFILVILQMVEEHTLNTVEKKYKKKPADDQSQSCQ